MLLWMIGRRNHFLTALIYAAIVFLADCALPTLIAKLHKCRTAAVLSGPAVIFTAIALPFTIPIHFLASLR